MTAVLEAPTTTTTSTPTRVLEALVVPWHTVTRHVRVEGFPGGERIARGAFATLLAGGPDLWRKVRLTDSHLEGTRPVGFAVGFVDTEPGLVARFQMFSTPEGRSGWENVAEQTYGGVSVGFVADEVRTLPGRVREVVRARLDHVSLVDQPAYREAQCMALHETDAEGNTVTVELEPMRAEDFPVPLRNLTPPPVVEPPSSGHDDAALAAWAREHRAPMTKAGPSERERQKARERFGLLVDPYLGALYLRAEARGDKGPDIAVLRAHLGIGR